MIVNGSVFTVLPAEELFLQDIVKDIIIKMEQNNFIGLKISPMPVEYHLKCPVCLPAQH